MQLRAGNVIEIFWLWQD